jgi:hypothetical protein
MANDAPGTGVGEVLVAKSKSMSVSVSMRMGSSLTGPGYAEVMEVAGEEGEEGKKEVFVEAEKVEEAVDALEVRRSKGENVV